MALFLVSDYFCRSDPVISTDLYETQPGVYLHGTRSERIAARAGLRGKVEAGNDLWPKNGDSATITASTVWKVLLEKSQNLKFFRTLVPLAIPLREANRTKDWTRNYMDTVAVDWFFADPDQQRKIRKLVLELESGITEDDNVEKDVDTQLRERARRVNVVRTVAHAAVNSFVRRPKTGRNSSARNDNVDELSSADRSRTQQDTTGSPLPDHNCKIVTPAGVAIMVPGVGGDSSAGYINAASSEFLKKGFNICVLNPRGIALGHKVSLEPLD